MFISCILYCCTQVLSFNTTWTEIDKDSLATAQGRCREIYPKSPCLVKFNKVEEQVYRATCGVNNNAD